MRDNYLEVEVVPSLHVADAGPGASVDLADCNAALAVIVADGTGGETYTLQESDDDATWADVADADVLSADGTNGQAPAANEVAKIGYIGSKRYVRVTTSAAGGAAVVVKERLRYAGGQTV